MQKIMEWLLVVRVVKDFVQAKQGSAWGVRREKGLNDVGGKLVSTNDGKSTPGELEDANNVKVGASVGILSKTSSYYSDAYHLSLD